MTWKIESSKEVLKTHPFVLEEIYLSHNGKNLSHPYTRIAPPDWVNILPITKDNEVIAIEQYRVGSDSIELEIPGGVVDPGEEHKILKAAQRELEEETGYFSDEIIKIGINNPNPAIQTNQIHFFLAKNCHIPKERSHFPDEHEDIKIKLIPCNEIEELVRSGKIQHCLAAHCVLLALPYLEKIIKTP